MRIDKNSKLYKRGLLLIEYILCLVVIELVLVFVNVAIYGKNNTNLCNSTTISTNKSATEIDEEVGNVKIEVFESDETSYYIRVDLKNQTATAYVADENGEYTIPIKKMVCSTGVSTPENGVFKISDKYEWGALVGNVYGQYCTRITGPILFHSVPYTSMDKASLEYWEYDKLGQAVSKGCVRLTVADAKWIYENCKQGTQVEFCEQCNDDSGRRLKIQLPIKISDYGEELKNWDPTDPDLNNPWREYEIQNEGESK